MKFAWGVLLLGVLMLVLTQIASAESAFNHNSSCEVQYGNETIFTDLFVVEINENNFTMDFMSLPIISENLKSFEGYYSVSYLTDGRQIQVIKLNSCFSKDRLESLVNSLRNISFVLSSSVVYNNYLFYDSNTSYMSLRSLTPDYSNCYYPSVCSTGNLNISDLILFDISSESNSMVYLWVIIAVVIILLLFYFYSRKN